MNFQPARLSGLIILILGVQALIAGSGASRPKVTHAASANEPEIHNAGSRANSASSAQAGAANQTQLLERYGKLPLSFEANGGQSDARVKFLSRGAGYTLFLTHDGAVLSVQEQESEDKEQPILRDPSQLAHHEPRTYATLRMQLLGANPQASVSGVDELPGKTNYFRGNNPKNWQTNVANYAKVRYEDVYPGVDLVYYGNQGQLEYDFVVAAGADPQAIAMSFTGARRTRVDAQSGDLVLKAGRQEVRFHKPVVYQVDSTVDSPNEPRATAGKHFIEAHYVVDAHHRMTFQLAPYDHGKALVIDPTLSYSTYLGGTSNDYATSIAVDSAGSAYVIGYTGSTNFPVTSGAFQTACKGGCSSTYDAFVTKLDPTGSTLVYSTYLGGSGNDYANGIALDAAGDAYLVGQTFSSDFPVTTGVFQSACGGTSCSGGDAFVAELNPSGSGLVYSTYLGGSSKNQGNGIVLDAVGDAYITGWTQSTNFPITTGAFQSTCSCSTHPDAFVTELNPSGTALVYSTYLGGSLTDVGYGITLDATGDAYVTGYTQSLNFPTSAGAFQNTLNANSAGFITELNPTGTAIVYSTYLGGSSTVISTPCGACTTSIAVDSFGDAFVTGLTAEANFPVTPGAYQSTLKSSAQGHNAFITELNPTGTALVFSTYLGGSQDTGATGIALDPSGNIWLKGNTKSTDFPVTGGAFQTTSGGNFDFWVAELNPTLSTLLYSTYLGGSGIEFGGATKMLVIDTQNPPNVYVTGYTNSTNFPTTTGAFQIANAGANDGIAAKFAPSPNVGPSPSSVNFGNQLIGTTSGAQTVTLTNTGNLSLSAPAITISGTNHADFNQTNTCTSPVAPQANCSISVTFTPTINGTETANVMIADSAPNSPQNVPLTGTGFPPGPAATLSPTSLTFPTTLLHVTSSPQTVTLTNVGTTTLTVTSITTSGDFGQTNNCIPSVLAGANCSINVTFTPTNSSTRTGTLTITDNAPNKSQTASLTGVGTVVQLSPTSLNFGTVKVGKSSTSQTVTLKNIGSTPLTIRQTSITGTDPKDFTQTNNCGGSVAKGASCTFTVTFKPLVTGALTASLTITDTGGGSPQTVPLSGTGQ